MENINKLLAITALSTMGFSVYAQDVSKQNETSLKTVTIIAKKNDKVAVNFPGAASSISGEDFKRNEYLDLNRIARDLPGVTFREQEGFGLRPNIGIRASRNYESGDINLLEDGTMIAPAPYSAPNAYYFPDIMRMEGFEVFKGGSALQHGPRSTSGTFNMITKQIDGKNQINTSFGSFGEKNLNAKLSKNEKYYGYMLNLSQRQAEGFRQVDTVGGNTGYNMQDYMSKFRFNTNPQNYVYNQLDVKLAGNNHTSNQTYLGLTEADFAKDPNRAYASSQLDKMTSSHKQYEATHTINVGSDFTLKTKAYHNEFQRNWYKLDKIAGKSISSVVFDPSANASTYNLMTGATNSATGQLDVKANSNKYISQGVQTDATINFDSDKVSHKIDTGIRFHKDSNDAFRATDKYNITNGVMSLYSKGSYGVGSGNNFLNEANATSSYIKDTITIGKLILVPGLRHEMIKTTATNFNTTTGSRDNITSQTNNNTSATIMGLSSSYQLNDLSAIYGGVNQGFAPVSPTAKAGTTNEKSVNYELGYRYAGKDNKTFLDISGFWTEYSNLLGQNTSAGLGVGSTANDQYNAGAVTSRGIEFAANTQKLHYGAVQFPIGFTYTYIDATFKSNLTTGAESEWGNITAGNRVPYISRNQFSLNTGVKYEKMFANLATKYVSNTSAMANGTQKIPSYMVLDIITKYDLDPKTNVFIAIDNITNRKYGVAYQPAGLRPGRPRSFRVGLTFNLN